MWSLEFFYYGYSIFLIFLKQFNFVYIIFFNFRCGFTWVTLLIKIILNYIF